MLKSNNDQAFNLIYKSLKHFNLKILQTSQKKYKPIPEDKFINYCLNLLQIYLKSKSQKYFVFWLLDHFSSISNDSQKINKDFQNLIFSWKHYCLINKQAENLLMFLKTSCGTHEVISEFLKLRKQILKHSTIKNFDKITIDYQNILLILNKLYSNDIRNAVTDKLKLFYQKTITVYKYDTKVEATLVSKKQQYQNLQKYLNESQIISSVDTESQVYDYIIFDSVMTDQEQNTFLLDNVTEQTQNQQYVQSNTFSVAYDNKIQRKQFSFNSFKQQQNRNQRQRQFVKKQMQQPSIESTSRSWNSINKKKLLINRVLK